MDERRTGNRTYDIKEVSDHQMEIARALALGESPDALAARLSLTRQTISNFRNHPVGKALIKTYHEQRDVQATDIARQIASVAPAAISLLKKVVTFDSQAPDIEGLAGVPEVSDQIRAATSIVRTVAPRMSLHKHVVTGDLIKEIKRRSFEGRNIEEAEVIEDETI